MLNMSELPSEFTNPQVVRDNQRYSTYKAEYEGAPVFIKQVKAADLTDGIRRELWGLEAFRQLAETSDLGFTVPQVIANGKDYVVTSWAEGEPIELDPKVANYDDQVTFFADSLAKIDMLTCLSKPPQAKFDMSSKDAKAGVDKLKGRLGQTTYTDYFDKELIDKGFQYLYKSTGNLAARLTHADFTPGNVLENNGQRTLIDYESVSLLWPRFYDLVNLTFNRIMFDPELTPGCLQIVDRYFSVNSATDIESATPQMNAIAMLRSLSLIWEHITEPNDYHNTQRPMTQKLSERLSTSIAQILVNKPYFESFR
jgi:thiamine kinase-like enzyme